MGASIESGFIASLPKITNQIAGPNVTSFSNGSMSVAQGNTIINNFLTSSQYPSTYAGFIQAVSAPSPDGIGNSGNNNTILNAVTSELFDASNGVSNSSGLSVADSTLLANLVAPGLSGSALTTAEQNFATSILNNFFANLSATQLGGNSSNYFVNFQKLLSQYMTQTVTIFTNSNSSPALPSYQSLFVAFKGDTSTADFQSSFTDFYNTMMSKYGYFLPSQMLPQWINQLSTQTNPTASIDLGTGSSQTQIIFQLLALVSQMINTLQDVSTAQVERLTFYANWQQAYTNLIAKIPVVTFSDINNRVKSDNNNEVITAVQQIGNINQNYTQQAEGYRDSVSSESKSQQSAVDQSQQALQSQSSLATTLLQNLSTILQTMFQA